MTHQTLYRKYRPQRFADVVGQEHVTRTLQNAVAGDLLGHAYLFCGPRGTGKTTTARLLAKALNCRNRVRDDDPASVEPCNECESCIDIARGVSFDTLEVDAATHRGIDDIRALSERAQQAATDPSRFSVFIIDEVHQLSRDGASAFLKTLEEPPGNVVFVLATTDPDRMIGTILSRCQRFDFKPVTVPDLTGHLAKVAGAEGIEAEAEALEAMARRARGGVRDSLALLEQASALCEGQITVRDVRRLFGGLDSTDLANLTDHMIEESPGDAISLLDSVLGRGIDPRVLTRELASWLRGVFLCCVAPDATDLVEAGAEDRARMSAQAGLWSPARATRALSLMGQALSRMPQSLDTRIELESTFVSICVPEADASPEALAARVEALERRLEEQAAQAPLPRRAAPDTSPPKDPAISPGSGDSAESPPGKVVTGSAAGGTAASDSEPVPQAEASPSNAEGASRVPPATGPAPAAPKDLSDVDSLWGVVVSTLKSRNRRVGAFFVDSEPKALDGDTLVVTFAHAFNRDQAMKDSALALFRDVTSEVLGASLRLNGTVVGDRDSRSTAPSASPAGPPREEMGTSSSAATGGAGGTSTGDAVGGADAAGLDEDVHREGPVAGPVDVDEFESVRDSVPASSSDVLDLITAELGAEIIEERKLDG